jgi:hypothetical protein
VIVWAVEHYHLGRWRAAEGSLFVRYWRARRTLQRWRNGQPDEKFRIRPYLRWSWRDVR